MARKFREPKSRSTDRGGTVRRANESRGRPAPARQAPTQVRSPLRDRMAALRGGGGAAPSRDPRQGAIDFGRSMTGGGGGTQQAVDAIRNRVMQQLGQKGIYQDDRGSYQIQGMERGGDPGIAIRNMAVHGMGGPSWDQIVADADARLRQGGTPGGGVPPGTPAGAPNGTSMADAIINGTNRQIQTSRTGQPPDVWPSGGGVPQPGLGGVPPMRPPSSGGTVPQPGLGGVPPMSGRVPGAMPNPPGYPNITSIPQPGLGGVGHFPGLPAPNATPQGIPSSGGPAPQPGLGGVPSAPGGNLAAPTPMTGVYKGSDGTIYPEFGGPIRPTPQPGLGGVPSSPSPGGWHPSTTTIPHPQPGVFEQGVPSPGLGGVPSAPQGSRQNFQGPSAPQQGIIPIGTSRTTPVSAGPDVGMMGSVLGQMERSRQSQPLHGLFGGTGQTPADANAVVTYPVPGADYPGGLSTNQRGIQYPGGGVPSPGLGGVPASNIYAPPGGPPTGPIGLGGSPAPAPAPSGGFPPQGQGVGRTTPPTGGQVSPTQYPTTAPQPGLGGVMPAAPGRVTTPVVPPGSLPGNTTPSRPGQMPSTFPNGSVFGTSGATQMPSLSGLGASIRAQVAGQVGQRSAPGIPGMPDLSTLGSQIQQTVASRTSGIRGQAQAGMPSPITNPAQTAVAGLEGLGDRIRQSIMSAQGGTPGIPGVGTSPGVVAGPDLGGLGSSIMERVRSMTQMPSMGQLPASGLNPVPTTGTAPTTGVTPGAPVPPGGAPTAAPAGSIGAPQGAIPGGLQIAFGRGGTWDSVNQYDASFVSAGQKYGVDPAMLKAMAVIESGGQMIPNQGGSGAYGVMQIKEGDWGWLANQIGADLSTADGQIQTAAAILGQYGTGSTPEERFVNSFYPTGCMDCTGEDGATPRQYLSDMQILMGAINAANTGAPTTPGTQVLPTNGAQQIDPATGAPIQATPVTGANGGTATTQAIPGGNVSGGSIPVVAGPATTGPGGGVYNTIATPTRQASNGQPVSTLDAGSVAWADALTPGGSQAVLDPNTGGYGFDADQGIDIYGAYNQNTWPCHTCHPGVDVSTNGSQPYKSLTSGTVTCVGGRSAYGDGGGAVPNGSVSCGAYTDDGGGVGNVSVLKDDGALIVYGHSRSSNLDVGAPVQAGQDLGMSGSNNGYHIHAEIQLPIGPGGQYAPVDPDLYYSGYYCGQGFCPS